MNSGYTYLTKEQNINAIQRLTALWAFTESGLGGVMHALQIPFTGLLVGGMAVIMISMIAKFSKFDYKQILKSAIIVLIVKAMVSPYTPFPAYVAVSFQALLGYALFSLFHVNFLSIVLLSTIAMIESAIQKLLIQTLLFGESLWKAMDVMVGWLAKQFGSIVSNGSYWIVGVYLFIYLLGGLFIARLAYGTIKIFESENSIFTLDTSIISKNNLQTTASTKMNSFKKLWFIILVMLVLSAVLFFFATDKKQGWLSVVKTITWTLCAVLTWFMIIGPLFTKAIQKILQKRESKYSDEVLKTLSFIPVLKQLTNLAWQQSKLKGGIKRWYFFVGALIHNSLTYSETS